MLEATRQLWIKTALFIWAGLLCLCISYAACYAVGITPSILEFSDEPQPPAIPIAASQLPARGLLVWIVCVSPFFILPMILDLLEMCFVPQDYTLSRYSLRRLNLLLTILSLLIGTGYAYNALYLADPNIDFARHLLLIWYALFQSVVGIVMVVLGGVAWHHQERLPRAISGLMILGGTLSFLAGFIGLNNDLPIFRISLMFLPYCIVLAILGAHLLLVASGAKPADA